MKKITRFATIIFTFLFALTSCDPGTNSSSAHEHTFASFWVTNDEYHWHPSTCGHDVKGDEGRHEFTSETNENGDTVYTCSICHYSYSDGNNDDKDTYTVTWKNYDGTILEIDNDVESGTMPTYDGEEPIKESDGRYNYTFASWTPELEPVTKDTTYTATFSSEEITYTITWENYDGTVLEIDENVSYGTMPTYDSATPTKESDGRYDYTFAGWTPEVEPASEDTTYTAVFTSEEITYTVDFDLNGGTSSSYNGPIEVKIFSKDIFFFDCVKEDWQFRGWEYNGEKIFDEKGNQLKNVTLVDNMLFKAVYSQTVKLTITTNMPEAGTITGEGEYPYNTYVDVSVKPNQGYKFVGWYYQGTLLSNTTDYKYMMWDEDITLEARFEKDDFNLRIYSNNEDYGLVLLRDENYLDYLPEYKDLIEYKTEVTIAAYSKSNIRFLGWYDENNTLVTTNAVYTFVMPNYDYTLEAKWNYFTINYNLNGGVNNKNNVDHFDLEDNTIYLFAPTKEGYSFEGWRYNGEFVDKLDASIADNITLEAIWSPYEYEIKEDDNGKYAVIIGYDDSITDVVIPETVTLNGEKIPVKEISQTAFKGNQNVKSIIVSNEVTTIDETAFDGCSSLVSIYLPISVTTIGSNAFNGCSLITIYSEASSKPDGWSNDFNPLYRPVVWNNNSQYYGDLNGLIYTVCQDELNNKYIEIVKYIGNNIDLVIPETINVDGEALTVKSISENAFYNNDTIIYASIPNSVLKIGNNAFRNCINLKEITISENALLTKIGSHAFDGCKLLSNIKLPVTVNEIGSYAFYNCSSLLSINIPDSVTTIGEYTFTNCSKLANVSIGENSQLTVIGQYAFNNCSSLTSIYIPSSVTTIGNNAFEDCSNLTTITIGENSQLTTIGNFAFTRCSSLTSFFIPSSVTTIGDYAFRNCSNLTIYCEVDSKQEGWSNYWNNSNCPVIWNSYKEIYGNFNDFEYIVYHDTEGNPYIVITEYNGSNTNVIIPEYINVNGEDIIVKKIGYKAFYDNDTITSVTIPDSVTTIGGYAFSGCSNLTTVTISENSQLTTIEDHAFQDCSSLTSIFIPSSVTTIGDVAFSSCSNLTICCEASSKSSGWDSSWNNSNCPVIWNSYKGIYGNLNGLEYIAYHDTEGNSYIAITGYNGSDTDVVIPEYIEVNGEQIVVEVIASSAFENNERITSITIPDSVTTIGTYAFYECDSLATIYIPDSVTTIGESAFYNCSNLTICCEASSKSSGWDLSWNNSNCPVIWNSYKGIYGNLNGLKYIAYHDTEGNPYIAITNYSGANTNVVIPEYINVNGENLIIKTIAKKAFYDNDTITSVTIPDSVTIIGTEAFNGCSSLTTIYIPASVTTIGQYAFRNCSNLTIYCEASFEPSGWDYNWNYSDQPVVWNCEDYGITVEGIHYVVLINEENVKYITIIGYTGSSTNVVIPSSINVNGEDIPVKVIADNAFYNNDTITSVTIPASVTTIGSRAFYDCDSLTSIYIPDSVTTIGDYAFSKCSNLATVSIGENSQLTAIGQYAFFYCPSLISIYIPNSVTTIEDHAFQDCSSLTSIYIPSSVTKIGYYAFEGCSNLTIYCEVSSEPSGWDSWWNVSNRPLIWNSYKGIYGNLNGLEYIAYHDAEGNPYIVITGYNGSNTDVIIPEYIEVNGEQIAVNEILNTAFKNNTKIKSITIPDGVTTIGDYAFQDCSSLTSIYIPDSVTTIGYCAFYNCYNLTTVTIGENSQLTSIGYTAFYHCSSLTSIYIPNSVTSIGQSAFYGCSSLTSIYIPDSVTTIGYCAFYNCYNLTTVTIGENNQLTTIGESAFEGCSSLASIYIPDTVTTIGESAFEGCSSLTSICIPDTITTIGEYAFGDCSNLTTVTIGENSQLTTIGNYAFYNCSSLTSIYIPNTVTTIGEYAFGDCSNLTTVTISENSQVTTIGDYAFDGCSSLTSIYIPSSVTTIGTYAFYECDSLTTIYIPDSVTTIGDYAFSACSNLTTVTISENSQLTTIEDYAFDGCSSLTSIYIPNSVTSIGSYAFDGCFNLIIYCEASSKPSGWNWSWNYSKQPVVWSSNGEHGEYSGFTYGVSIDNEGNPYIVITGYNGSNTDVVIPEYINVNGEDIIVKEISNSAFRNNTEITSITIPDSVTTIEYRTFYNCTSLTSIYIPNSVTSIGSYAFDGCSNLTTVTFGENSQLTIIGVYAFRYCSSLTSIYIPDSVTTLGENAFGDCSNLTTVTIGENSQLTTIGLHAFYNCVSLTSIYIPDSVTTIEAQAFDGCSSLTSIYIPDSVTTIGNNAFYSCSKLTIYCEVDSKQEGWLNYWHSSNQQVVWNCTYDEYLESIA